MDPIADMLTRIRNASAVGNAVATVSYAKLTYAIAEILQREGWVTDLSRYGKKNKKLFDVTLRYEDRQPAINGVRRISKPGKRVYRKWTELNRVRQGFGAAIISTPKGLLTDAEARKQRVGGEVLLEVW